MFKFLCITLHAMRTPQFVFHSYQANVPSLSLLSLSHFCNPGNPSEHPRLRPSDSVILLMDTCRRASWYVLISHDVVFQSFLAVHTLSKNWKCPPSNRVVRKILHTNYITLGLELRKIVMFNQRVMWGPGPALTYTCTLIFANIYIYISISFYFDIHIYWGIWIYICIYIHVSHNIHMLLIFIHILYICIFTLTYIYIVSWIPGYPMWWVFWDAMRLYSLATPNGWKVGILLEVLMTSWGRF